MGKKLRPFEFYAYDGDNTMYKNENTDNVFTISQVKEEKNEKYIKPEDEAESGATENNG